MYKTRHDGMLTQDIVLKICRERWMIGTNDEAERLRDSACVCVWGIRTCSVTFDMDDDDDDDEDRQRFFTHRFEFQPRISLSFDIRAKFAALLQEVTQGQC